MSDTTHSEATPSTPKPLHPDRLLRWPDVKARVGICRSHAHQLAAKGLFPSPIKVVPGGRASAWSERSIQNWVDQRIADSHPIEQKIEIEGAK